MRAWLPATQELGSKISRFGNVAEPCRGLLSASPRKRRIITEVKKRQQPGDIRNVRFSPTPASAARGYASPDHAAHTQTKGTQTQETRHSCRVNQKRPQLKKKNGASTRRARARPKRFLRESSARLPR